MLKKVYFILFLGVGIVFSSEIKKDFIITSPISATEYRTGNILKIKWQGATGNFVTIKAYDSRRLVEVIDSVAPNNGKYTFEIMSEEWVPSTGYRIQILDADGDTAWSEKISISKSVNEIEPLKTPPIIKLKENSTNVK